MVIALCYDLQDTYDISSNAVYKDFSFLSEVEYVETSLKKLGHRVILINGIEEFVKGILAYKHDCDIVFNMIEGYKTRNREGLVPALCEAFDIPCTGTDAFGMSLSLNKYHMCQVVKSFDIKTPHSYLIDYPLDNSHYQINHVLEYPCVIKPNHEGSGMGVVLAQSKDNLTEKIYFLSEMYKQQLVVEEYIAGMELSVGILGCGSQARVYSCLEFLNKDGSNIELFDYECKYNTGFKSVAPRLGKDVLDDICTKSLFIHKIMHFRDVSRIDWRVNNNVPYFIEATPLPAFDIDSDFDIGSKLAGESFEIALKRILLSALSRKNEEE